MKILLLHEIFYYHSIDELIIKSNYINDNDRKALLDIFDTVENKEFNSFRIELQEYMQRKCNNLIYLSYDPVACNYILTIFRLSSNTENVFIRLT